MDTVIDTYMDVETDTGNRQGRQNLASRHYARFV
jgi:hypothetical protein